jgi:hypothetical protein
MPQELEKESNILVENNEEQKEADIQRVFPRSPAHGDLVISLYPDVGHSYWCGAVANICEP